MSIGDLRIVIRAPSYWKYLTYFSKVRGLLFINRIYLGADIFDDIQSNSTTPYNVSILIHEQTHYERMQKQGMIRFGIKYLFSIKGRFEEEISAISAQMRYLKQHNETYDIERAAKALSSVYYLWCSDYKNAYERLVDVWKRL